MAAPKTEYAAHCASLAKRKNIQRQLEAVAAKHEAVVSEAEHIQTKFETVLVLTLGGWRMNCDLDAHCPSGVFMGNWHTDYRTSARYDPDFAAAIAGDVNTHHFRKATLITDHLEDFLDLVDKGLAYLCEHKDTLDPTPVPDDEEQQIHASRKIPV